MAIPDGLSFDELNKLYEEEHDGDLRSMPFEQFFGEMDLSQEQKRKRIETAREVQTFIRIALMEMYYGMYQGDYGEYDPSETISENYQSLLDKLGVPFTMMLQYRPGELATEITLATMNHPDDSYFFSEDRAMLIAENEANSIWNDAEFQDAILTGKTRKTWVAMKDKRTRETHRKVDGTTLRMDEYFSVGEAMLLYPRMSCEYPEEVVNCRCTLTYS